MKGRLACVALLLATLPRCAPPAPPPVTDPPQRAPVAESRGVAPAPETAAVPDPAPVPDPAAITVVQRYTEMFYRGEIDLLHGKFSSEMQQVLSLAQLSALHEHVIATYGKETRVIAEDAQSNADYRGFVRWARFDKTEDVIEVKWILKPDDTIAGFFIQPATRKVRGEGQLAIPPAAPREG